MADENVDKEIVDRLRADGHDVLFIAEDYPESTIRLCLIGACKPTVFF